MQQKALLISSMQKLINHIVVSRKNQQQIFSSLSKNDFRKIISNLDDQNPKLRKISLALLSQLLANNPPLKEKFCVTMNIPLIAGRVALNTKLCAGSTAKPNIALEMAKNIKEVYTLIKQPVGQAQQQQLWFVNYSKTPLSLQHAQCVPTSISADLMDPVDCMVGFVLVQRTVKKQPVVADKRRSDFEVFQQKPINNYFRPTIKKDTNGPQMLNQSMGMTPGHVTDRQVSYIPKSTTNRPINTTLNTDQRFIRTGDGIRNRYTGGIKVVSGVGTSGIGAVNRSRQEESGVGVGRFVSFPTSNVGRPVINRVQRGYETLREKKVVGDKYQM